jgi:outer membrane immunogenic protein
VISRLLLTAASIAALAGVAHAADLPNAKGAPVFVPPPPVFTWTGPYVGAQLGYQWGTSSITSINNATGIATAEPGYSPNGVVGGAHIGYNWQMPSVPFVVGVEGDVEGTGYNGSGFATAGIVNRSTREDIEGSIRVRGGITWDRALIYATGGAAFASIRNVSTNTISGGVDTFNNGRVGWTVGGGVEYAIDNNWSIRAEYRYTDFGRFNENLVNSTLGTTTASRRETDNAVRAGFSYKFDTFAPVPVVAKY